MANLKEQKGVVENPLSQKEAVFMKHKKTISIVIIAIILVVAGVLCYNTYVSGPREQEASTALAKGQDYFANQQYEIALKGDSAGYRGFVNIASDYSSTDAGNLAELYAGLCYANLGKWNDAVIYLEKYSPADDQMISPAAMAALGNAYAHLKEYDKAIATYQKALEIADSTDYMLCSRLICGMADAYSALGDTTQAYDCYEKSLRLFPDNDLTLNNFAYFLAVRDMELDRAEQLSAKAVSLSPESPTVLDTYAWVFFRKKEYSLALAYIEKAIKNCKEDNAEILEHYGDILFMNGQFDQAVENWEKALELDPESEILRRKVEYKTYFNE